MSPIDNSNLNEIYDFLVSQAEDQIGIINLNSIIYFSTLEQLQEFLHDNGIQYVEKENMSKLEYFRYICRHFYNEFEGDSQIQSLHTNILSYIGDEILKNPDIRNVFEMHDFLSKQELINKFADWCADLGISVFSTAEISDFSLDLYFTKKTPFLRTESVVVRTGKEMNKENYEKTLNNIENSSKIAAWTVFVTTPLGAYKVGLFKLIGDMERLNTWLYIVDPLLKRIFGIVKGKKSKDYDSDLRDQYIQKLPREPIRAPSQVVKFSKYDLTYSESYKTSKFASYSILSEIDHLDMIQKLKSEPKYKDLFRNIIISDKNTGLPMVSLSNETNQVDQVLISGFLSAMDDFVSKIGGSSALKEINYKGFFVQAAYGKYVKIALFLSKPSDKILKERLSYLLELFESRYQNEIETFRSKGDSNVFKDEEIFPSVKYILDI
jgi:hypothetical protein